jgi:cysteine desulfurase
MTPVLAHPRPRGVASAAPNTPPVYFDNQSSTRVDPRVLEAMLPHFTEDFGNPHSTSHA